MSAAIRAVPLIIRNLPKNCSQSMAFSVSSVSGNPVLVNKHDTKRIITLNRPKALNALNLDMVREIYPQMREWNDTEDVNLVIIKGSGDKAFCAGGDVLAVVKSYKAAQNGENTTMYKDFFREEYMLNHLTGIFSKQYVALIDGIVMGGGCGLSVNGKFRVCTERTMLAMPETALGLFPDVGGSYFLSRLKGSLGMYLALTGYRLLGADSYHSGLATHYINSTDLPKLETELLNLKNVTEDSVDGLLRSFEPKEVPEFRLSPHLGQIRDIFNGNSVEEIIGNLEQDGSDWAKKQISILKKMSPTSLKVTHKQLTEGSRMNYAKIFTMEFRLTQRFLADNDFHEGCRAILIDKDRNPKWNPATLEEVTDERVEKYFAPLPNNEDLKFQGNI
ncbi:unnamed protein product [Caenorhabditis bovis]|uniref:3-hydroxyisobutyryl-CoA hydrolase, mitochondrial n=1 Tax=Caenorhabditis bovis TaxID=2654633 RepID=A0A8S1EWM8_9PELO|nr:unnamed protein product [Caenorhabditis bovis]